MPAAQLRTSDALVEYELLGDHGDPLVLVHGWACRAADWRPLVEHLGGRRVLLLDLPWHGASTSSRVEWTIAGFGELVAELVRHEGLSDVTLVGHSMGGAVAVEAAARLPGIVRHVVGIDAFTYLRLYPAQDPTQVDKDLRPFADDFRAAVRATVESLFVGPPQPELRDRVHDEMASTDPRAAVPALRSLMLWDLDEALERCRVAVTALASKALLADEALERYGDRIRILPLDLGGHFYLRERPAGAARAMLDAVGP